MSDERESTPLEPEVVPVEPVAPAAPASGVPPRRRSGAVGWGIVLILVGAALLVSQFVPGIQAWRFWPLIIIALGVRQLFGPSHGHWTVRNLGEGLSTIAIGLVFLGQMLGILQWDVWLNILRLWPLLLVSLGLEVIGKGLRNEWLRLLGSLVIVAGLAYGSLVMTQSAWTDLVWVNSAEATPFEFSEKHESSVKTGSAKLDGGAGEVSLKAGDELATSEGASPFTPVFDVSTSGGEATVRAGLGSGSWGPWSGRTRLDVTLDREVAWDLDISAGVSTYEIDLRDLLVGKIALNAGVSNGTLTLGAPEGDVAVPVRIDAGVSSLTIRVPRGESARVVSEVGLMGIETEGEWNTSREGDKRVYESDGFSDGGAYWDIDLQAGISGVTLEYY
jgi:hypothetical protein